VANIRVVFLADVDAGTQGPRASGTTDETGHYRLRTDNGDDGAVVGQHRIRVVDQQAKNAMPAVKRHVPPQYGRFNETPLRVEVQPGPQVIDLDIQGADIEVRLLGAPGK
jgi:hypothetical protein